MIEAVLFQLQHYKSAHLFIVSLWQHDIFLQTEEKNKIQPGTPCSVLWNVPHTLTFIALHPLKPCKTCMDFWSLNVWFSQGVWLSLQRIITGKESRKNVSQGNPKHKYRVGEWIESKIWGCLLMSSAWPSNVCLWPKKPALPWAAHKKSGQQVEGRDSPPALCSCVPAWSAVSSSGTLTIRRMWIFWAESWGGV